MSRDRLGNVLAREGCDRCVCGCKYWEKDRCVDCGTHVIDSPWRTAEKAADTLTALIRTVVPDFPSLYAEKAMDSSGRLYIRMVALRPSEVFDLVNNAKRGS